MNFTRFQADHSTETGLVSDEVFITIDQVLGFIMVMVSLVGIVTNAINIWTFIAMGLRDGVSISLLGLSISDLGATSFSCVFGPSIVIGVLESRYDVKTVQIQPYIFLSFSANISFIFYQVTCFTTTFLAVARCMCVAMPFRFKDAFTKSRSVFAQVVFAIIGMTIYVPVLSQMGAEVGFDRSVNRTRLVLWLSDKRSDFKDIATSIESVIVIVSTFVVFICVLVMVKHLRKSVQFRNLSSSWNTGNDASGKPRNDAKEKSDDKLSGKELQVVRQVVVICIIYTACISPKIIIMLFRLVDGDFEIGKRFQNLYRVISSILLVLTIVNSATTFPVYYVYNSKFRSLVCSNSRNLTKHLK